ISTRLTVAMVQGPPSVVAYIRDSIWDREPHVRGPSSGYCSAAGPASPRGRRTVPGSNPPRSNIDRSSPPIARNVATARATPAVRAHDQATPEPAGPPAFGDSYRNWQRISAAAGTLSVATGPP